MCKPSHTWQQQLGQHQFPPVCLSSVGSITPSDLSPIPAFPATQPSKEYEASGKTYTVQLIHDKSDFPMVLMVSSNSIGKVYYLEGLKYTPNENNLNNSKLRKQREYIHYIRYLFDSNDSSLNK